MHNGIVIKRSDTFRSSTLYTPGNAASYRREYRWRNVAGYGCEMNEKLVAFRRRLHSDVGRAPKEKPKIKDFLSLAISSLALVVSVITGYFNLLWQSDDIRVVIHEFSFHYDPGSQFLELGEMPEWTFINSGNRSAAIRSVTMAVAVGTPDSVGTPDCGRAKEAERFGYQVDPFVIKPAEIIPKTFHIRPGANVQSSKALVKVSSQRAFLLCVMASIITPDSVTHQAVLPLLWIDIADPTRDDITIIAIFDH